MSQEEQPSTVDLLKRFDFDFARFWSYLRDERAKRADERRAAYGRWHQMMRRCYDPQHHAYANYGGRGIFVATEWHDFEVFHAQVGAPPDEGLSLDRIDNDGPYAPGNVRWATASQQARNQRPGIRKAAGSVLCINGRWRALVRLNGKSACRTFATEDEAREWASLKVAELRGLD